MIRQQATRQVYKGILANTISVEKSNAAKEAQDHVPPIPVEPGNA